MSLANRWSCRATGDHRLRAQWDHSALAPRVSERDQDFVTVTLYLTALTALALLPRVRANAIVVRPGPTVLKITTTLRPIIPSLVSVATAGSTGRASRHTYPAFGAGDAPARRGESGAPGLPVRSRVPLREARA
jgi:hypothetical protein